MHILLFACAVVAPITDLIKQADLMYRQDSFISFEEFKKAMTPGKLFMRTDLFTDSGADLVDELQRQLGSSSRLAAVRHFVEKNIFELMQALCIIFKSTSEAKFIILKSRTNPSILKETVEPLRLVLLNYVRDRPGRPLYDSLPASLRDPVMYDLLFTAIDSSDYRIIPGDTGIIAVLPDEERDREVSCLPSFLGSRILFFGSLPQRIIDVNSKCAVDLKPRFKRAILLPKQRCFIAKDTDLRKMRMWLCDSDELLKISVPSGMVTYRIRYLLEESFFELVLVDEFNRDFDTIEQARKCLRFPLNPNDESGVVEALETQTGPVEELSLPMLSLRAMGSNSGICIYGQGFTSVKSVADFAEYESSVEAPSKRDVIQETAKRTERRRVLSSVASHLHNQDYSAAWREVQVARDRFVERKLRRTDSHSDQPALAKISDAIDRTRSSIFDFWMMFDG